MALELPPDAIDLYNEIREAKARKPSPGQKLTKGILSFLSKIEAAYEPGSQITYDQIVQVTLKSKAVIRSYIHIARKYKRWHWIVR